MAKKLRKKWNEQELIGTCLRCYFYVLVMEVSLVALYTLLYRVSLLGDK